MFLFYLFLVRFLYFCLTNHNHMVKQFQPKKSDLILRKSFFLIFLERQLHRFFNALQFTERISVRVMSIRMKYEHKLFRA